MNMFSQLTGFKMFNPMEIVKMDTTATLTKKNPLVIYHGNCADGFSAAWVFYDYARKQQDRSECDFEFHAGVYQDAPPDVTGRVVYLVDFSYKRAVVHEMLDVAEHIYLIDHHQTALDDLKNITNRNFTAYTDLERSGAMLAWDFLYNRVDTGDGIVVSHPGTESYVAPPILLEHIQDRDLWKFKFPDTRAINAAIFSYEYTFENWDMLMKGTLTDKLNLFIAGSAIERKHFKDIKELLNVCQRFLPIGPYVVPAASIPYTMSSDAGHSMAKAHADGKEFAACYIDTATHRVFSLRSTPDGVDVSAVAKEYGGGGHRNAAGFRVPRDHILARS